jgi:membrane-associated protein
VEPVVEFLKQCCETFGYPALFVIVLLENAGIPVPGETALLVGGFMAGEGTLDIRIVIVCAVVAAVIGDNTGFWLGRRWARPRLQSGRRFLFLTPRALRLAEGYFTRFGVWTIFFARFITGIRVVGALAAGTAGMPWPRFLVANMAGAIVWSVTIGLLGLYFGQNWKVLEKWLGRGGLIALLFIIVAGATYWHFWRSRRRSTESEPASSLSNRQTENLKH